MSEDSACNKEAGWPTEIPVKLENVRMKKSDDGKFITCVACELYDHRKFSKNGVVVCARGRIFKYDSMVAHVKNEYHTRSMLRQQMEKDGAILTAEHFRKKYGKDFAKRKKVTTMGVFFAPVPKKSKNSEDVRMVANAPITQDEVQIVETMVGDEPNVLELGGKNCSGAFSTLDRRDTNIQKGLKLSLDIYLGTSGVIKTIKGSTGVYSMFHPNCDGINVQ